MTRFFLCGLLVLAGAGCTPDTSKPTQKYVESQRKQTQEISDLRKKQMDEVESEEQKQPAEAAETTEDP